MTHEIMAATDLISVKAVEIATDIQNRLEKKAKEQGYAPKFTSFIEYVALVVRDAMVGIAPELAQTNKELEDLFDLRHAADCRAVKRWRRAHPGNDLRSPDHADLVVWLIEQLEPQQKQEATK